jgi:hypothetical protein
MYTSKKFDVTDTIHKILPFFGHLNEASKINPLCRVIMLMSVESVPPSMLHLRAEQAIPAPHVLLGYLTFYPHTQDDHSLNSSFRIASTFLTSQAWNGYIFTTLACIARQLGRPAWQAKRKRPPLPLGFHFYVVRTMNTFLPLWTMQPSYMNQIIASRHQ